MATRGRPPGQPKSGGRVAGKSLDRQARALVSNELAGNIMETFRALGGVDDMIAWAAGNRTTFYTAILSRLYPSPQRDDPDVVNNTQINIGSMSHIEAARRVAFMLASAEHSLAPIEAERIPEVSPNMWQPPTDVPNMPEPNSILQWETPMEDPQRQQWAAELELTDEQRRDRALIRNTIEDDISTYDGGSAQQARGFVQRQPDASKPTSAQLCRRLSQRGRDLL